MPFELLKTQHMVVNVKVNGKGPYRLIFDTGAPDSLVSNKVDKEAGLVAKGVGLLAFLRPDVARPRSRRSRSATSKAENVSATVFDHPTVKAISRFVGPIDGIIGFTFYARYKMSINYEKKEITFEPNTYKPGKRDGRD